MVRSMTGFGRAEAANEQRRIVVEIKSVNHRYLDLSMKMPKRFNLFESRIRSLIKQYASRGKVDLYVSTEEFADDAAKLHYHAALAEEYTTYVRQISETCGLPFDLTASRLASMPDVFTMEHPDEDEEASWPLLEEALHSACTAFAEQRLREGGMLAEDILGKLSGMEEKVAFIEARSPETVAEYEEKLAARIRELLENTSVDESRLMTEVAIFADKVCVDEEMVRLRSHIRAVREALTSKTGEGVGRRLDFLAQEMNREANTTLSKCSHLEVSAAAIDLKTEIEKIREQVQNLE